MRQLGGFTTNGLAKKAEEEFKVELQKAFVRGAAAGREAARVRFIAALQELRQDGEAVRIDDLLLILQGEATPDGSLVKPDLT